MNKREFKKAITSLGSGMAGQMINVALTSKGVDREISDEAIVKIVNAMENAKHGANITYSKKERDFDSKEAYLVAKNKFFKEEFNKIAKAFSTELDEAVKKFNEAMPAKS